MRCPLFRLSLSLVLLGGFLAACNTGPGPRTSVTTIPEAAAPPVVQACATCGQVERIETITTPARKAVGPMQGGVLGGVLSKPASTPATTSTPAKRSFRISLKLEDGRRVSIYQASISPNLKVGSRVRVDNGRVILLR